MSHSRVETGDDMAVDEAGVALPTPEWMEAARKAADTDGILENASAKRQKVCISCHTLTSPAQPGGRQHLPFHGLVRRFTRRSRFSWY